MDETRRHMTPVRRPRARRARPLVSRPSHPYLTPHGTPYPLSTYLLVPCAFGLCQSNVHPNGEPIQRAERRERTSWGMPGRVRNELSVCLSETTKAPRRLHVDGEAAHLAASTGTAHEPNAEESNAVRGRVDEHPRGRHAAKRRRAPRPAAPNAKNSGRKWSSVGWARSAWGARLR